MINEVFGKSPEVDTSPFLRLTDSTAGDKVVDFQNARVAFIAPPIDNTDAINKGWLVKFIANKINSKDGVITKELIDDKQASRYQTYSSQEIEDRLNELQSSKLDIEGRAVDSLLLDGKEASEFRLVSDSFNKKEVEDKIGKIKESLADIKERFNSLNTSIDFNEIRGNVSEALNTLEKLSSAINNDANFHFSIQTALETKLNKNAKASDSSRINGQPITYYLEQIDEKLKELSNNLKPLFHKIDGANGSRIKQSENSPIDCLDSDNHSLNLTTNITLSFENVTRGQSGVIIINGANFINGYAVNLKWQKVPSSLKTKEIFCYFVESDESILIGRVS